MDGKTAETDVPRYRQIAELSVAKRRDLPSSGCTNDTHDLAQRLSYSS
jgi:hypothetical protein